MSAALEHERAERLRAAAQIERLLEELRAKNEEIGGLREQLRRADARNAQAREERGRFR